MHIVRSRGLEGDHGTWDEFMKSKHPGFLLLHVEAEENSSLSSWASKRKMTCRLKSNTTVFFLLHLYMYSAKIPTHPTVYSPLSWYIYIYILFFLFQLLQAWILNPSRFLARLLSDRSTGIIHESVLRTTMRPTQFTDYSIYSRWQILVKTTLSREDYPLDYFLSPPFEVCMYVS